jgi:hypothetical protein
VEDVEDRELLFALLLPVRDVGVEDERRDRGVAVEHNIEIRQLVADHALILRHAGVERRFVHVAVAAADDVIRAGREAPPVLAVGGDQRLRVLVDERLTDPLDLGADLRGVRRAVGRNRLGRCR